MQSVEVFYCQQLKYLTTNWCCVSSDPRYKLHCSSKLNARVDDRKDRAENWESLLNNINSFYQVSCSRCQCVQIAQVWVFCCICLHACIKCMHWLSSQWYQFLLLCNRHPITDFWLGFYALEFWIRNWIVSDNWHTDKWRFFQCSTSGVVGAITKTWNNCNALLVVSVHRTGYSTCVTEISLPIEIAVTGVLSDCSIAAKIM